MLRSLHIENIAVIRTLDLETEGGFTAMTGETGAGKSIVIDSINFLLCNRTGRELVRTGQSRACVSAVFDGIEGKNAFRRRQIDLPHRRQSGHTGGAETRRRAFCVDTRTK